MAVSCLVAACEGSPLDQSSREPNIILIVTDDQELRSMPYMRGVQNYLVDEGITFERALTSFPSCCPSRATILTGMYTHNHGVISNMPPAGGYTRFRELGNEQHTVALALQQVGYRTALIGKYLNGYPSAEWPWPSQETPEWTDVPPGWDYWFATFDPSDLAGTRYWGYHANKNGELVSYRVSASQYHTDVLRDEALNFIRGAVRRREPFFLMLTPIAPHEPPIPAPRHAGMFSDLMLPRRPSFNELDVSDKPLWVQQKPLLTPSDEAYADDLFRGGVRQLQAVDEAVQEIFELLMSERVIDNTWVFYTSDNGFHYGEHRLEPQKSTPYEEDIRVPLVVRGPGVPRGVRDDAIVLNTDLMPTILDIVGSNAPQADGHSFLPRLMGIRLPWRAVGLLEVWGRFADPWGFGLRGQDYSYVEWHSGEVELYDLSADPFQMQNIVGAVDPAVRSQLHSLLTGLRSCAGAACWTLELVGPGSLQQLRP